LLDNAKKKRYDRLRDGDLLGMRMLKHTRPNSGIVWAAFSILEEDHCGIDIATERPAPSFYRRTDFCTPVSSCQLTDLGAMLQIYKVW